MRRLTSDDFPALAQVFSGYLHEDFQQEHGTPVAAIGAFLNDASQTERRQFRREARRFLVKTASLPFEEVRALLARLGCRWLPDSRLALADLLAFDGAPADPLDS
jgi:hypothetical protein